MAKEMPDVLGSSTGFLLHRTASLSAALFERSLARHDVTRAQYTLLMLLDAGRASTPIELAHALGTDAAAISRLSDRLADKGLVERRPSATDGRSVELGLTASGRECVPALERVAARCNRTYLRGVSGPDRARLLATLATIRANCREALDGD